MLPSQKYFQKLFKKTTFVLVGLIGMLSVQAQQGELNQIGVLLNNDTLYQDTLLQFLSGEGLLPEFQLVHLPFFNSFTERQDELERIKIWERNIEYQGLKEHQLQTQVSNHNYLFYGDTIFTKGVSANWYSDIGIQSQLSFGEIPIVLGANAVFAEGKFQSNLSTFSFSFDSEQFLENMKSKHQSLLGQDLMNENSLFDLTKNPLQLSNEEWEALQKETQYVLYERIINHPKFRLYQSKLHHQLDSLLQSDSLNLAIDSIQIKLEKITAVVDCYRKSWDERKGVSFETKKAITQKVEEWTTKLEDYSDPEKVKDQLLRQGKSGLNKNNKVTRWQRLLLQTKAIDIGLFDLDDTDLTAKYLALNGIRYSFDDRRIYGEFAYGNQSLNTSFIPSLNALWLNRYYGNRFLFSKVGVKGEDESVYTQVSFLRGDVLNNPEDSLFILPKRNTVIAWTGQMKMAKKSYLNAEFGVSDQDIVISTGIDGEDDEVQPEKIAFAINGRYEIDKWNTSIEVGYFYNGAQYYTLGNPFLLTNRQGLNVEAQVTILNERLIFKLDSKYGTAIDKSAVSFNDFQLLGELQYQFKNQNSLIFQVMPNVYQQTQIGINSTRTGANNWIYSLQGNFFKNIRLPIIQEAQLISVFNATNLQNNLTINGATVANSEELQNYAYLYLQEMLLWNERQNISLTGLFGFDDWYNFKSGNAQLVESLIGLEYAHAFSKLKIGGGGQLIKRQIYGQWQYGIQAKVSYQFWERGSLSIHATYRNKLKKEQLVGGNSTNVLALEQYFGNVSMLFSL